MGTSKLLAYLDAVAPTKGRSDLSEYAASLDYAEPFVPPGLPKGTIFAYPYLYRALVTLAAFAANGTVGYVGFGVERELPEGEGGEAYDYEAANATAAYLAYRTVADVPFEPDPTLEVVLDANALEAYLTTDTNLSYSYELDNAFRVGVVLPRDFDANALATILDRYTADALAPTPSNESEPATIRSLYPNLAYYYDAADSTPFAAEYGDGSKTADRAPSKLATSYDAAEAVATALRTRLDDLLDAVTDDDPRDERTEALAAFGNSLASAYVEAFDDAFVVDYGGGGPVEGPFASSGVEPSNESEAKPRTLTLSLNDDGAPSLGEYPDTPEGLAAAFAEVERLDALGTAYDNDETNPRPGDDDYERPGLPEGAEVVLLDADGRGYYENGDGFAAID